MFARAALLISVIQVALLLGGAEARIWLLEREGRAIFARRFGQAQPAVLKEIASACDGGVCDALADEAVVPLLAGQPECSQQDMADKIIDASRQFDAVTQVRMIAAAVRYRETEKNTPPDFSTYPPTLRNSVFCQKAPKHSVLSGLVQAQDPANDPNLFYDPATKATVIRGSQSNTFPFRANVVVPGDQSRLFSRSMRDGNDRNSEDDSGNNMGGNNRDGNSSNNDKGGYMNDGNNKSGRKNRPHGNYNGDNKNDGNSKNDGGDMGGNRESDDASGDCENNDSDNQDGLNGNNGTNVDDGSNNNNGTNLDDGSNNNNGTNLDDGSNNNNGTNLDDGSNIDNGTNLVDGSNNNGTNLDDGSNNNGTDLVDGSNNNATDLVDGSGNNNATDLVDGIDNNNGTNLVDNETNLVDGSNNINGTDLNEICKNFNNGANLDNGNNNNNGTNVIDGNNGNNNGTVDAGNIGNFGSCSVPEIQFAAGFDGRRETSFEPVDKVSYNHGSAQNIGIITQFICDQLVNTCKADETAKSTCANAKLAAAAAPPKTGKQADAFNAVFGKVTNFASVTPLDDQGNPVAITARSLRRGLLNVLRRVEGYLEDA